MFLVVALSTGTHTVLRQKFGIEVTRPSRNMVTARPMACRTLNIFKAGVPARTSKPTAQTVANRMAVEALRVDFLSGRFECGQRETVSSCLPEFDLPWMTAGTCVGPGVDLALPARA